MEDWLQRTFNELGKYVEQSFMALHAKVDETNRDTNA